MGLREVWAVAVTLVDDSRHFGTLRHNSMDAALASLTRFLNSDAQEVTLECGIVDYADTKDFELVQLEPEFRVVRIDPQLNN
ncbi:hypothetical protein [Methylobacterium sp. 1030]|uniref:hypothetical protein n=1 Tax=Methylobacterium sp. 1030 TaxID=3156404 RepID=UPI0033912645